MKFSLPFNNEAVGLSWRTKGNSPIHYHLKVSAEFLPQQFCISVWVKLYHAAAHGLTACWRTTLVVLVLHRSKPSICSWAWGLCCDSLWDMATMGSFFPNFWVIIIIIIINHISKDFCMILKHVNVFSL